MALPLLAGALVAGGSALSGVYSVGRSLENRKYWDAYYRRTGFRPKYLYRAGYNDYIRAYGSVLSSAGYSYGLGYANYFASYRPSNYSHYMYG